MEKLTHEEKKRLKRVEKLLGSSFWRRSLLKRALTHKSYTNEKKLEPTEHNERLEYLGDAVLELVVSHTLMELYPTAPEGELSKFRAAMVNEKTLAWMANALEIGEHLFLGKGEELGQGREKPSLLADAYEAVLGALYLDRGFRKTFQVVREHAKRLHAQVTENGFYKDYKTLLQERAQQLFKMVPRYRLVDQLGPDHNKLFRIEILIHKEVFGVGEGKSKKEAEQEAAQQALQRLQEVKDPVEEGASAYS